MPELVITDPMTVPVYPDGPVSRWCQRSLYEARDEVFVRLSLRVSLVMSLAMVGLFFGVTRPETARFWWLFAALYWALWGWLSAPVILMLHCTMHRPFIKRPKWLGKAHPLLMSFYFGIPTGYAEHHMGMHHLEDNMEEDLSSTLRYRRDSFLHFLHYFGRFLFLVIIELPGYLNRRRRTKMARKAVFWELVHFAVAGLAIWASPRFGIIAFVIPTFMIRLLMMVGNWGQHAFINTLLPNDGLTNSITCINSGYNRRAFNDGYHVGHHLKANRHWAEMPQDFLDNKEAYAKAGVLVFEGIDFFLVSILLWTGQWGTLAKKFVRLDGPRSDEEVVAMLKSRVLPVRAAEWTAALA